MGERDSTPLHQRSRFRFLMEGAMAPLQRMELQLGLLQGQVTNRDPRSVGSRVGRLREEVLEVKRRIDIARETPLHGANQAMVDPYPCIDPKELIPRIADSVNTLAERREQTFINHVDGCKSLPIASDDFEIVITSLFHNAIRYGHPQTYVELVRYDDLGNAAIHVRSYRLAIPSLDHQRVLECGYRTSQARESDFTAAGVGIYAARRILQRWGTQLVLESSTAWSAKGAARVYRNIFCVVFGERWSLFLPSVNRFLHR